MGYFPLKTLLKNKKFKHFHQQVMCTNLEELQETPENSLNSKTSTAVLIKWLFKNPKLISIRHPLPFKKISFPRKGTKNSLDQDAIVMEDL